MRNVLDGLRQGSSEDVGPCSNLPPKHRTPHCGRAEALLERLLSTGRKNYFWWSSLEVTHVSCWAARREFTPESRKQIFALNEGKQSILRVFILCFFKAKVTDSNLQLKKLCRVYSSAGSTLWLGQELLVCTERLILLMAACSALDRHFGTKLVHVISKCALVMNQYKLYKINAFISS